MVALLVLSPETQRADLAQKTTDLFSTVTAPFTPSPAQLLPLLLAIQSLAHTLPLPTLALNIGRSHHRKHKRLLKILVYTARHPRNPYKHIWICLPQTHQDTELTHVASSSLGAGDMEVRFFPHVAPGLGKTGVNI